MSDSLRPTSHFGNDGHHITDSPAYFRALMATIANLPYGDIEHVIDKLHSAYQHGRTLYLFGNGGSAALASHMACDLGKGTSAPQLNRKRFRVIALTDNLPLISAWANDTHYDEIFSQQLCSLCSPGDVAFAISGSGNSPNVLKALNVARENQLFTIGLTGFRGGKMKDLCDLCVVIPCDNMQVIEDLHLSVAHSIFTALRYRIEQPQLARAAAGIS